MMPICAHAPASLLFQSSATPQLRQRRRSSYLSAERCSLIRRSSSSSSSSGGGKTYRIVDGQILRKSQPRRLAVLLNAVAGGSSEDSSSPSTSTDTQATESKARQTVAAEQYAETEPAEEEGWQPVVELSSFPKGTRQKVTLLNNNTTLMIWYRKKIYAIEPRSPAEAAFSEGFQGAKLTQDGKIVCPTTDSTFDIKTGKLVDWYPSNVLLRLIEPKCRDMEVWPVLVYNDMVYIRAVSGSMGNIQSQSPVTLGGSNTSLENNNVYGIEPKMYINDPSEVLTEEAGDSLEGVNPATLVVGIVAVGIVGVAGTAVCLYYQTYIGLALFWAAGFGAVAVVGLRSSGALNDD